MMGLAFSLAVVQLMVSLKKIAIPPLGLCWRSSHAILYPGGMATAMSGADAGVNHVSVRKRMSWVSLSSRSQISVAC